MSYRVPRSGALRAKKKNKAWPRHPDDWYIEPIWCGVRFFQTEPFEGLVWDPACGAGRVLEAARVVGLESIGSDIKQRGGANFIVDFARARRRVPNIVSNIPFKHAKWFVPKALELADRKVALLLPAAWMLGNDRSIWLETTPLETIHLLAPRPPMPPGPVVLKGGPLGGGVVDFAWFVWRHEYRGSPQIKWLRRDDDTRGIAA